MIALLALVPKTTWVAAAAALGFAVIAGVQTVRLSSEKADHSQTKVTMAENKAKASKMLADETGLVLALERKLADKTTELEKAHAEKRAVTTDYERRLRSAAGPAGRLRDPNAKGCGRGGESAASTPASGPVSGPTDPAQADGLLSAQLTGLLQRLTREADDINDAYATCRADALNLRALLAPP